jgi:hypothetical protein
LSVRQVGMQISRCDGMIVLGKQTTLRNKTHRRLLSIFILPLNFFLSTFTCVSDIHFSLDGV